METNNKAIKIGDYLIIRRMECEPLYEGRKGYVTHIDDLGQLFGSWGELALIPQTDNYEVLNVGSTKMAKSVQKNGHHH